MPKDQVNLTPITEAVVEDAANLFWQFAERSPEPPPSIMCDTMVSPPSLKNSHGQAGQMLRNMGHALTTYVKGDVDDAVNTAQRTMQTIRNLASYIWDDSDEHGLPRHCYALTDGTTLAKCAVSGEWEQIT